jgi:hypothetical protein
MRTKEETRMKEIGVVAIVVVGLLTLAQAVDLVSYPIATVIKMEGSPRFPFVSALVLSLLPLTGSLVLGALLISNRQRLAERWFQDADISMSLEAVSLLRLGLIIIGVNFITDAIPLALKSASDWIVMYAVVDRTAATILGLNGGLWDLFHDPVRAIVELGMGLLLIARSRPLANYLWADRTVDKPAAAPLPKCPACGTPYDPADYQGGMTIARCSECKAPLDVGRS